MPIPACSVAFWSVFCLIPLSAMAIESEADDPGVEQRLRLISNRPDNDKALQRGSWPIRVEQEDLDEFLKYNSTDLAQALMTAAESEEQSMRLTSLSVLIELTRRDPQMSRPLIPGLAKLLEHSDASTVFGARVVLLELGSSAKSVVWEIVASLPKEDMVRLPSIRKLGEWGLPEYIRHLNPRKPDECRLALALVMSLGSMAQQAEPRVEPLITADDPQIRMSALQTMGVIARSSDASRVCLQRATDPNELTSVRAVAVNTYATLGQADTPRQLQKLLTSNCPDDLRLAIARAMARSAATTEQPTVAIDALTALLDDTSHSIVNESIRALGSWGSDARATAPHIIEIFRQPNPPAFKTVSEALSRMQYAAPEYLSLLRERLSGPEQSEAFQALALLGPHARSFIPDLHRMLDESPSDPEPSISLIIRIMKVLIAVDPDAADFLLQSLSSKDRRIQTAARIAFRKLDNAKLQEMIPDLEELKQKTEDFVAIRQLESLIRFIRQKSSIETRDVTR